MSDFEIPEQSENRQELANWQHYHAGLFDGGLRTDVNRTTIELYSTNKDPRIREYLYNLFGVGALNEDVWYLYDRAAITEIFEKYSLLFELTLLRRGEFISFNNLLMKANGSPDKHATLEWYRKAYFNSRKAHVPLLDYYHTEILYPYLAGLFDSGTGGVTFDPNAVGRSKLCLNLTDKNIVMIKLLCNDFEVTPSKKKLKSTHTSSTWRIYGVKAANYLREIKPFLFFRAEEVSDLLKRLPY